jgi:restriction endonuclease S subunit
VRSIRLSEVARIYNGNSINERVKAQNFVGLKSGTPYVATKDISYGFQVDYDNGVLIPESMSSEFRLAKKGSVLLCAEGGSAGRKMAIIDRDIFFVNKLFCFECNDQLNSKYLFYYLQSSTFQALFKKSITGLIGGVSLGKVRNLPISLPSLEEQDEIVRKLDTTFAEIDSLEANFRFLEISYNELTHSIQRLSYGNTSSLVKIGEVCKLMTGGTPSRTREDFFKNGTVKWLVSGDIHKGEILDCEGRITVDAMKSANTKVLPINSVMIALNGQGKTRGTVAILRTEATCNQSLVSISPINPEELMPEFLYYNLKMRYQELRRMTGDDGNDRRGLNMILIREIEIPLPSMADQIEIVKNLKLADESIQELKIQIELKEEHVQGLRNSLLSRSFSERRGIA